MAIEKTKEIFIPASALVYNGGTWTDNLTNPVSKVKTAADVTVQVGIPINTYRVSEAFGLKIKSIKLIHQIGTAPLDTAPIATLVRNKYGELLANGTVAIPAADSIPVTSDLVAAIAANPKMGTITVTNPVFDKSVYPAGQANYFANVQLDCAATTTLSVFGAIVTVSEIEGQ